MCMHIGYVPRERPPFSALNFRSGAYHFHKLPKNPFRSITILQFLADFAVSETIIFNFFFYFNPFIASHGRLSPNAKRPAARGLAAGQSASQTRPGSSGDSHFHAQNGSSSFSPKPRIFKLKTGQARSGAPHFHARSGARSGARAHFSICRGMHIPTKIWGKTPPPPPPGRYSNTLRNYGPRFHTNCHTAVKKMLGKCYRVKQSWANFIQ